MWNLKRNDTNELTYKTEKDSQPWRRRLWLSGDGVWGRDSWGVWDGPVPTAMFKIDSRQGPNV